MASISRRSVLLKAFFSAVFKQILLRESFFSSRANVS